MFSGDDNPAATAWVVSGGLTLFLAASLLLFPAAGAAGRAGGPGVLFTFDGASGGDKLGMAVIAAGDLNGDGTADFAAGIPHHDGAAGKDCGRVTVYSGADRSILYDVEGVAAGEQFGFSLCRLDDVDGDGIGDLAVGAPTYSGAGLTSCGRVYVLSGATGAVLGAAMGKEGDERFGYALARAGDWTGDGVSEILAGAPNSTGSGGPGAGRVVLLSVYGKVLGELRGEAAGDFFGASLCAAGNTGAPKPLFWLVGAPYHDGAGSAADAGRVYVYLAGITALVTVLDGAAAGDRFGEVLASGGDADGDGREDVLVGIPGHDGAAGANAGGLRAYSGRTGAVLHDLEGYGAKDGFGSAAGFLADVDGDGCDEILAGAPFYDMPSGWGNNNGRVYLFDGRTGALNYSLPGSGEGDTLGTALYGSGDMDGDGIPDFLAGAPSHDRPLGNSDTGRIHVVSGADGSEIDYVDGLKGGDQFGYCTAGGLSDIDGDGLADFLVGAIGAGAGRQNALGSVTVIAAADGATLFVITGDEPEAMYGSALAEVGDVNGDGLGDFLVGAPYHDAAGMSDAGRVYLYYGGSDVPAASFSGEEKGEHFGAALAAAGDLDGDGRRDFLVGAPGYGQGRGRVRVYSGRTHLLLGTFKGTDPGDLFGAAVASAGDADGDGVEDILAGAPGASPSGQAGAGRVRLFSGSTGAVIETRNGENAGDSFGSAVAGIGDLDGDGLSEYIAGADRFSSVPDAHNGAAYVFSPGKTGPLYMLTGESKRALFGASLAGVGDADGDGIPDFAVAGFRNSVLGGLGDSGRVCLYSGAAGTLLCRFDGETGGDQLGISVCGAGDVNGDGRCDLIAGAHLWDEGNTGYNTGRAYVFFLAP